MARDIDFRAPGGRESLCTTDQKFKFSRVHSEVLKKLNLDFYSPQNFEIQVSKGSHLREVFRGFAV
jgi:hypothetical protein